MSIEENTRLGRIMERRRFGMKPGLDTMRAALKELGDPQQTLRFIHVAGTNGKGAVCAILDEVLRAAGYRVGRYTSPHLVTVNERFFLDGAPATDDALAPAVDKVLDVVERLEREQGLEATFFETLTLVAFVFYAEQKPDVVVLETGLGGRCDATNVVETTLVSVITHIGLDHCEWLGATHSAIAEEKAGIIKPGRPVICGVMPQAARDVIARAASLNGSPFLDVTEHVSVQRADPLTLTTATRNLQPVDFALKGAYQVQNAMTAVATLDALVRYIGFSVPDHEVVKGLRRVVWPGRAQHLQRDGVSIYVDGAHNPDGALALRDSLRVAGVDSRGPVGLIAGFCGDKDVLAHLRIMSAFVTRGWATPIRNARSLDPKETAERMQLAGFASAEACTDLADAFARGCAWAKETGGSLVVCGSLFLVAEALVELGAFPWPVRTPDPNELSLR